MRCERETDARTAALMDERENAVDVCVAAEERNEGEPSGLRPVEAGPDAQAAAGARERREVREAVAAEGGVAAVEAQAEAGEDVDGEGGEDEEGLEEGGLVVGACEEEEAVGGGDGAREEGEEGGVGEVEGGEEGEGVGGVFLEAGYWGRVRLAGMGKGGRGEIQ
jgi:hypothetical protein